MGEVNFAVPLMVKLIKKEGTDPPLAAPVFDLLHIKVDAEQDQIDLLYSYIFSGNYFYHGKNSNINNKKKWGTKHGHQLQRLPKDIEVEIMARLPATSIMRLRSVCHDWYDMPREPSFIAAHLAHANKGYIVLDPHKDQFHFIETNINRNEVFRLRPFPLHTHIIGSCNGILCLGLYDLGLYDLGLYDFNAEDYNEHYGSLNAIYLYNPLLGGDYLQLPQHPIFPSRASVNYGFYFDHVRSEFKVVVFVGDRKSRLNDGSLVVNVSIETCTIPMVGEHIGTPQPWKIIKSEIYINNYFYQNIDIPLILVNGKLHVLVNRSMIVSFDIATEEITYIPLYFVDGNNRRYLCMGELGGRLFVTNLIPPIENATVELWVMEDNNNLESWSKLLTVHGVLNLNPYMLNEDEVFVLPYAYQPHFVQHTPSLLSIPSAEPVPP